MLHTQPVCQAGVVPPAPHLRGPHLVPGAEPHDHIYDLCMLSRQSPPHLPAPPHPSLPSWVPPGGLHSPTPHSQISLGSHSTGLSLFPCDSVSLNVPPAFLLLLLRPNPTCPGASGPPTPRPPPSSSGPVVAPGTRFVRLLFLEVTPLLSSGPGMSTECGKDFSERGWRWCCRVAAPRAVGSCSVRVTGMWLRCPSSPARGSSHSEDGLCPGPRCPRWPRSCREPTPLPERGVRG